MKAQTNRKHILYVCQAGIVAALYTVLTYFVGAFDLASGAVQFRVSEALCVMPVFFPAAIPGLTIGCVISNLITGGLWQDVVFGSLATLVGALGAYLPFITLTVTAGEVLSAGVLGTLLCILIRRRNLFGRRHD